MNSSSYSNSSGFHEKKPCAQTTKQVAPRDSATTPNSKKDVTVSVAGQTCPSNHFVSGQWKDRNGNKHSTEWIPYAEWMQKKKEGSAWWSKKYPYPEPNYRCVYPNELVIEDDSLPQDKQEEVHKHYCVTLAEKGISGELWKTGGKGFHIQTLWDVQLNAELNEELAKKLFPDVWQTFDKANWRINNPDAKGTGRMFGLENQPHRNTGIPKTLVVRFGDGKINNFPKDIFNIIAKQKKEREEFFKNYNPKKFKGSCALCSLLLEKPFPASSGVHYEIVKNFVVLYPDPKMWAKAANTQNKSFTEFEGWHKWMTNHKQTFSCKQVKKYAEQNGLDKACQLCPHKKLDFNPKQWHEFKLIRKARFS